MASSRALHRQKKKPALNFGDFMMPLLGVLLVVILLLGIKILFFRSKPEPVKTPVQAAQTYDQNASVQPLLPEVPSQQGNVTVPQPSLPEVSNITEDPNSVVVTPVVVVPGTDKTVQPNPTVTVHDTSLVNKTVPVVTEKKPSPKTTVKVKPQPKPTPAKQTVKPVAKVNLPAQKGTTKPQAVTTPPSGKGFSVQTGSFTTEKAARDVATDLNSRGYKSRIERVEVKGRAFFRVYVAAGSTQAQAQDVENKIKALKTYDTLVVKDK